MNNFRDDGYLIKKGLYSEEETRKMQALINGSKTTNPTFRKTNDLFAIRQVLKEIPALGKSIFNHSLKEIIHDLFGEGYFVSKSIYFDKPGNSNWFVAYHQDLTISVKEKWPIRGYGPYPKKQDQFAVQPPPSVLKNNFTVRIHLDDTDEQNGALRVIPGSHLNGIRRADEIGDHSTEVSCTVPAGGIMLMHPLLFHASGRSTGSSPRRVIHIEFSDQVLPAGLNWSERFDY